MFTCLQALIHAASTDTINDPNYSVSICPCTCTQINNYGASNRDDLMGAPSFSGRGGGGGGGGQDRARGAPFDSREYVVRFRPIQRSSGGGGGGGTPMDLRVVKTASYIFVDILSAFILSAFMFYCQHSCFYDVMRTCI